MPDDDLEELPDQLDVDPRARTRQVNMLLPEALVQQLKDAAAEQGIGYQTLVRTILTRTVLAHAAVSKPPLRPAPVDEGTPTQFLNGCVGTEEAPHPRVYFFADTEVDGVKQDEWQGHCPVCVIVEMVVGLMGLASGKMGNA